MLRNLGAAIHCFELLMRALFLRSSLITIDCARPDFTPSRFEMRAAKRVMGSFRNGGHLAQEVVCPSASTPAQISKFRFQKHKNKPERKFRRLTDRLHLVDASELLVDRCELRFKLAGSHAIDWTLPKRRWSPWARTQPFPAAPPGTLSILSHASNTHGFPRPCVKHSSGAGVVPRF
jgi:hypothetical protein